MAGAALSYDQPTKKVYFRGKENAEMTKTCMMMMPMEMCRMCCVTSDPMRSPEAVA